MADIPNRPRHMLPDDQPRRRLQFSLKAILVLTALAAVAVAGLRYHLRVTVVVALLSPMVTTPMLLFIALSSGTKEQRLDLRGNPSLRPIVCVTVGSWILAFGATVCLRLWVHGR